MKQFGVLALVVVAMMAGGCSDGKRGSISGPQEEEAFMLVTGLGAEGRYAEAVTASDSLLANYSMSDSLRAYIMIERAVALANSGELERAGSYSDTLISFGSQANVGDAVMQGEQIKGVVYRRTGRPDSALMCYTRGLKAAQADANDEQAQVFYDLLSVLYADKGRPEEALKFAVRARDLARNIQDTAAMVSATANIGSVLVSQKKYGEAVSTLRGELPATYSVSPVYQIKYLTPLAHSYVKLDSLEQARQTVVRMKGLAAELPECHQSVSVTLNAEADLLGKEGRYGEQWAVYCRLDSLGNHGKPREEAFLERAACLAGKGDNAGAYVMMRNAYEALDSVRHEKLEKQLSELSVKYDAASRELEIERLTLERGRLVAGILLCLALIAIATILAVGSRLRYRRRMEREKQQEYIRGLEQERSRVARELHDDIAGELVGLQCRLAALGLSDESKNAGEAAGRVRRMSHELMPPEFGSLSFATMLVDYVARHNSAGPSRRLELTDEGSFDWDSLDPAVAHELYRIVQESVANALKHGSEGPVTITLGGEERYSLTIGNPVEGDAGTSGETDGIGVRSIRARADIIGAEVHAGVKDGTYEINIIQK